MRAAATTAMLDHQDRCLLAHLRGAFDRTTLSAIVAYFGLVEEERQSIATSEADRRKQRIGAATDAMRLDQRWYDVWRDPKLAQVFHPFEWVTYPVQIRHVDREAHLVPWHQDIGYMRLMPRPHNRVITCFIPLEEQPSHTSTLEFVKGSHPGYPHHPQGDHGAAILEPEGERIRFDLAFGDAIVFGDHVPHRTVPGGTGRIARRSFEFRLVLPGDALPDKDYFDLSKSAFVRVAGSASEVQ
jgi:hypothetical protein